MLCENCKSEAENYDKPTSNPPLKTISTEVESNLDRCDRCNEIITEEEEWSTEKKRRATSLIGVLTIFSLVELFVIIFLVLLFAVL